MATSITRHSITSSPGKPHLDLTTFPSEQVVSILANLHLDRLFLCTCVSIREMRMQDFTQLVPAFRSHCIFDSLAQRRSEPGMVRRNENSDFPRLPLDLSPHPQSVYFGHDLSICAYICALLIKCSRGKVPRNYSPEFFRHQRRVLFAADRGRGVPALRPDQIKRHISECHCGDRGRK